MNFSVTCTEDPKNPADETGPDDIKQRIGKSGT